MSENYIGSQRFKIFISKQKSLYFIFYKSYN